MHPGIFACELSKQIQVACHSFKVYRRRWPDSDKKAWLESVLGANPPWCAHMNAARVRSPHQNKKAHSNPEVLATLLHAVCEPFWAVMMRRFLNLFVLALAGLLAACSSSRADTTAAAPDFQQVYDLLRANLAGVSGAELNSAAVEGLLKQLHGRATIVGNETETASESGTDLIKSAVLENDVAYLRVGEVGSSLKNELHTAYHALAATNKIAGVALDLRFADGNDYTAAAATAGLFSSKKAPQLKWDNTIETPRPEKESIPGPLLVLVDGETSGAAEALAAELRDTGAGLIIGNSTAGLAMTMRNFSLKNGEILRIATDPVKLGNGTTISRLSPDITVPVSQEDERAYLKNPYAMLGGNENSRLFGTNDISAFVDHTSEADLLRERIKGREDTGAIAPPARRRPKKPVIQDPVLARALDLIKGLAIVHESRL